MATLVAFGTRWTTKVVTTSRDTVTQGVTDFAQDIAGGIVYVEVPRVGRKVEQGKPFMSMESGKWVGRISALVSGEIVAANKVLVYLFPVYFFTPSLPSQRSCGIMTP